MVIVFVIVFVVIEVMASEIARAFMPWMFERTVIGEIFAIRRIYTKPSFCAGKNPTFRYYGTRWPRDIKRARPTAPCPFSRPCYSAATTASPIAAVPTCLQSGVTMSAVR
ncbi:hypothetical protein SAMN05421548_12314 [Paraburkholderia lycopersici]|uniref:Uncharacterized protein n=1 Tax=Paraburkholderia lycopersici TaxID=416944 RepID=A0A1G6WHE0_9BURK|nr:hypothetical protein SAMN05421548_12314 [Paraburkholderia lycopersici]